MEAISIRLAKISSFLTCLLHFTSLILSLSFSIHWLVGLLTPELLFAHDRTARQSSSSETANCVVKNKEDSHQTIRSKFHNQNSLLSVASKHVHVRKKHVPVGCTHACFATKHSKFRLRGGCWLDLFSLNKIIYSLQEFLDVKKEIVIFLSQKYAWEFGKMKYEQNAPIKNIYQ